MNINDPYTLVRKKTHIIGRGRATVRTDSPRVIILHILHTRLRYHQRRCIKKMVSDRQRDFELARKLIDFTRSSISTEISI